MIRNIHVIQVLLIAFGYHNFMVGNYYSLAFNIVFFLLLALFFKLEG